MKMKEDENENGRRWKREKMKMEEYIKNKIFPLKSAKSRNRWWSSSLMPSAVSEVFAKSSVLTEIGACYTSRGVH